MQRIFSKRAAGGNMFASALLLCLIALIAGAFHEKVGEFFRATPAQNGLIVLTFLAGIGYAAAAFFRLQREFGALQRIQQRFDGIDLKWLEPAALALLPPSFAHERLSLYAEQVLRGTPPNSDAHHDRVTSSLNFRAAVLRYLAGVLIFLSLLGTFIGLLMASGAIVNIINMLPTGSDPGAKDFFDAMRGGLSKPLEGMAVAFSTSVFGIISSLILGFIHLQLAIAQDRYIVRLEAFDSAFVAPVFLKKLRDEQGALGAGAGLSLEAGAQVMRDNLVRLMTIVERTEAMQANFRDVMVAIGKEIELTNTAITRLAANQDLIREAAGAQVDLQRALADQSRLALAESQNLGQNLGRLNVQIKTGQDASHLFQDELLRTLQRELHVLGKILQDGAARPAPEKSAPRTEGFRIRAEE